MGHAVLLVVALLFIAASAVQIIPQVFAGPTAPATGPAGHPAETACARGVDAMVRALDRAQARIWSADAVDTDEGDPDRTLRAFGSALSPEWDATDRVEQACAALPYGDRAWAALLRLRRAHEQALLRDRVELLPLRRDVASHLGTDLR